MELVTPRFDNLQNELRRELDPKGVLEEELFQSLMEAAANRRRAQPADRYLHDRAFFSALREFRAVKAWHGGDRPRPIPPATCGLARRGRGNVIMFPSAAAAAMPTAAAA